MQKQGTSIRTVKFAFPKFFYFSRANVTSCDFRNSVFRENRKKVLRRVLRIDEEGIAANVVGKFLQACLHSIGHTKIIY